MVTLTERISLFLKDNNMIFKTVSGVLRDDSGATAVEYGLIVALIAVASLLAFAAVGDALVTVLNSAEAGLRSGMN